MRVAGSMADPVFLHVLKISRKVFSMFTSLPPTSEAFEILSWAEIEPWYRELVETKLSPDTLEPWMRQWSQSTQRCKTRIGQGANRPGVRSTNGSLRIVRLSLRSGARVYRCASRLRGTQAMTTTASIAGSSCIALITRPMTVKRCMRRLSR
jgi:hypothetical protein